MVCWAVEAAGSAGRPARGLRVYRLNQCLSGDHPRPQCGQTSFFGTSAIDAGAKSVISQEWTLPRVFGQSWGESFLIRLAKRPLSSRGTGGRKSPY
jgi:hypothetical protein